MNRSIHYENNVAFDSLCQDGCCLFWISPNEEIGTDKEISLVKSEHLCHPD